MQNIWSAKSDEVRQALATAHHAKNLTRTIKVVYGFEKWGEKWEQEADGLIASFEYFLAGDVHPAYRLAGWINMPQHHLDEIKKTMLLFGVDVDTLNVVEEVQPTKVEQAKAKYSGVAVVEIKQEALF